MHAPSSPSGSESPPHGPGPPRRTRGPRRRSRPASQQPGQGSKAQGGQCDQGSRARGSRVDRHTARHCPPGRFDMRGESPPAGAAAAAGAGGAGAAPAPAAEPSREMISAARAILAAETSPPPGADNVKALCELVYSDADISSILTVCADIRAAQQAKLLYSHEAPAGRGSEGPQPPGGPGPGPPAGPTAPTALCVGIVAPAGAGKSTFVEVLKRLLRSPEQLFGCGRIESLSLDDFLSSQAERADLGIVTRWDINSTNETFAQTVLQPLMYSGAETVVQVPFFQKALDERHKTQHRIIEGVVDVLLFEGWRVGCNHPNFHAFSKWVDTLIFIKVDFDTILHHKYEAVKRGVEEAGGHDMYEKFGGYQAVFAKYYRGNYDSLIAPVEGWCDIVLSKDEQHHFPTLERTPGRWQAYKASMQIERTDTVVIGASQAGLSASYFLKQRGVEHVLLVSCKALPFCCASTFFLSKTVPFLAVLLIFRTGARTSGRPGLSNDGTRSAWSLRTVSATCRISRRRRWMGLTRAASWTGNRFGSISRPSARGTICACASTRGCAR